MNFINLSIRFVFLHAIWVEICDLAREKKGEKIVYSRVFINVAIDKTHIGGFSPIWKTQLQGNLQPRFLKMWLQTCKRLQLRGLGLMCKHNYRKHSYRPNWPIVVFLGSIAVFQKRGYSSHWSIRKDQWSWRRTLMHLRTDFYLFILF